MCIRDSPCADHADQLVTPREDPPEAGIGGIGDGCVDGVRHRATLPKPWGSGRLTPPIAPGLLQLAGQRECYGRAVAPRLDDSDEAEALPKNPALREVVPAQPSDRTAMIDREAIEAKREQRRAQEAARNPPADPIDEDKTCLLYTSRCV